MAETKPYSDEELDFAENKLKVLSHIVEDDDAKAIKIARWCIEKERYDNMNEHWKNVLREHDTEKEASSHADY